MSPLETSSGVPKLNGAPTSELHSDPRWRLIDRILMSAPFQKSANLHSLLSFLAEHSILGKADALTERQIGIAVFGKPAGYSPAEDSAVRVHVRQLRLRIHEYFSQEGRNDTLRVDIPKGSYALDFTSRNWRLAQSQSQPAHLQKLARRAAATCAQFSSGPRWPLPPFAPSGGTELPIPPPAHVCHGRSMRSFSRSVRQE